MLFEMAAPIDFWGELFPAATGPQKVLRSRVLNRGGRPFLLLPTRPRCAVAALELYPAQTWRARLARRLLAGAVTLRLPLGLPSVLLEVPRDDSLARFLAAQAGAEEVSEVAVLAGNPATPGRRFILLVFNEAGAPAAVLKVGVDPEARALVRAERSFLEEARARHLRGVPELKGVLDDGRVSALSLAYIPGESPQGESESAIGELLGSWLITGQRALLNELGPWKKLEQAGVSDQRVATLARCIGTRPVAPAVFHGDFAPWNIKVSRDGLWMVLDWERGQIGGVPGWDWFHFVVQRSILVEKMPTSLLAEKLRALFTMPDWIGYAEMSGIRGAEDDLLLAYLLHLLHVIRPSEGLAVTVELLEFLWNQRR